MGKKKNEAPDKITLTQSEVDALMSRIDNETLTKQDLKTFKAVLSMTLWMQQQLSRAKLSIKRLRTLFGFTSEAKTSVKKSKTDEPYPSEDLKENVDASDEKQEALPPLAPETKDNIPANFDPTQNHGRLGEDDYSGCNEIDIPLAPQSFNHGQCPDCCEHNTNAKLYPQPSCTVVFLHGTPLISGTKFNLQKARCSVCEKYFTAELPAGLDKKNRYAPSCASSIAIHHYGAGLPFKRIEMLQKAQGIPLPDSTQYDLVRGLYESAIRPIVDALRQCAANGTSFYYDDTPGRILDQISLNKMGINKKGTHATAMLSEYQGHRIYLFDTNNQTAGKSFQSLLSIRDVDGSFMSMSDASASNFPELEDTLLSKWIICLCLAHGRRRFVELLDELDDDIKFILEIIATVYHHDRHCKDMKLSREQRLAYHQKHSQPLMDALFVWLTNLIKFKQVEPNSNLGEAILYMLKRWQWMTQFLKVPGAALDNNLCEQAIKVVIRYRKNSLFYRTFYGANIGDAMMSVLQTATHAGINLFEYLNVLQANVGLVNTEPNNWLPWHYQQTLEGLHDHKEVAAA